MRPAPNRKGYGWTVNRRQKAYAGAGAAASVVALTVGGYALSGLNSPGDTVATQTFTNVVTYTIPTVTQTVTVTQPPAPPPPPVAPPPPPPPPGPVLGSSLPNPLFHPLNVGLTYYVSTAGNDTTGDGSSGNPWRTPQKAADYLRLTATWPTNQDVQVLLRTGTYQAASGAYTLDLSFVSGARSPNANRWLIFNADTGAAPVLENPTGTDSAKGAIRIQNTSGNNNISFRHIALYGGDTRRGSPGNGNSIGLYLAGDLNDNIEFLQGEIHGFQASAGSPSSAQAVQVEGSGASGFKFAYNKVHDMGTTTGTTANQEHGYYSHSTQGDMVLGNVWWNIVNGYNCQFFGVTAAGSHALVVNNTFVDAFASGMVIDDSGTGVILKNNVYAYHTGRGSSSYGIEFYPPGTPGTGNVVDHNAYFQNTGGNRSSTPAGWAFTGVPVSADPRFVSVAGDDWHLQSGSPLYAAGDPNYTPPIDLDGFTRVAPTIGAYEAPEEGGVTPDPDPPPVTHGTSATRGSIDLPEHGRIVRPTVGQIAHTRRGQ